MRNVKMLQMTPLTQMFDNWFSCQTLEDDPSVDPRTQPNQDRNFTYVVVGRKDILRQILEHGNVSVPQDVGAFTFEGCKIYSADGTDGIGNTTMFVMFWSHPSITNDSITMEQWFGNYHNHSDTHIELARKLIQNI